MDPQLTGQKYDRIARWWQDRHDGSSYGVSMLRRALDYCPPGGGHALDVGCGAGGRMVRAMEVRGFQVTGIDVSAEMIRLAEAAHPDGRFIRADISSWQTGETFHLILAWDSIFHLPLAMQEPVVRHLCRMLRPGGVLLYTFGNAEGEHTDSWQGDQFYYSSLGIKANLQLLSEGGLTPMHLELDQYPEKHVCMIACRMAPSHSDKEQP